MDINDLLLNSSKWYEKEKTRAPIQINKYKKQVEDTEKELNEAIANNETAFIIKEYQRILSEDIHTLQQYEELNTLLRKPNEDDIAYRVHHSQQFPQKIIDNLSHDDMLCFHGTTILGAKNILLSSSISSGADRFGRATSFDPPGKISVTNKDTAETSIRQYMRLTDNFCYPAGCLFVVTAKNKEEYDNLPSGWMIDNVDFKENPDRLVAVITTPENIARVRNWAKEGGIKTSKIMDFDDFINQYQQQNKQKSPFALSQIVQTRKQKE